MLQKINSKAKGADRGDALRQVMNQRLSAISNSQGAKEFAPLVSSAVRAYEKFYKTKMSSMKKAVLENSIDQVLSMIVRSSIGTTRKQLVSSAVENIWDIENPVAMLFNLLSVVIPGYTFMEVLGVQPMPTKKSPLIFPQLTANDNRNGISIGDSLLGTSGWNSSNLFTSNRIQAVMRNGVGATTVTFTAPETPLLPGKIKIIYSPASGIGAEIVTDDGNGAIVPGAFITAGTVNYTSGAISLTIASATVAGDVISLDARWDLDTKAPAQAIFEFASKDIEAEPFRIRSKYKLDNFYSARKTLSGVTDFDLAEMLGTTVAGYINKEVSGQLLEDMLEASSGSYVWSKTPPTGVSWAFHRYSIIEPLIASRNKIRQDSARCGGNILVADSELTNIIESLGKDVWDPVGYGENEPIGPYVAGRLNGIWKVVKDQDLPEGRSFMTFKKSDLDAAGFAGVHVGLYATEPLGMDTLDVRQGMGALIGSILAFENAVKEINVVA